MSLWICADHGVYGGTVFCPRCGGSGLYVTIPTASVTGTGTAETLQAAQGEACQNGPQGDAQNTPQVTDNEL